MVCLAAPSRPSVLFIMLCRECGRVLEATLHSELPSYALGTPPGLVPIPVLVPIALAPSSPAISACGCGALTPGNNSWGIPPTRCIRALCPAHSRGAGAGAQDATLRYPRHRATSCREWRAPSPVSLPCLPSDSMHGGNAPVWASQCRVRSRGFHVAGHRAWRAQKYSLQAFCSGALCPPWQRRGLAACTSCNVSGSSRIGRPSTRGEFVVGYGGETCFANLEA